MRYVRMAKNNNKGSQPDGKYAGKYLRFITGPAARKAHRPGLSVRKATQRFFAAAVAGDWDKALKIAAKSNALNMKRTT